MKLARGLLAYLLVVYGPLRLTGNPYTRFGRWCLANSGDWVYRDV